ncbi:MAG: YdeI/OmpD-associated family protein [Mycobacteriaceae bacterium]
MKFQATVELGGKTATGLRVPAEVVEALGSGKRPRVHVTISGYTYRSTVAAYRGVFMLALSAENRTRAGVVAGQDVEVDVELDTEPRTVDVPADLSAALDADPAVRHRFDALSHTRRRECVTSVEGAKTPATRQRRIVTAVDALRQG